MKYLKSLPALALLFLATAFTLNNEPKSLEIGERAPMSDYEMEDLNGKMHSLSSLAGENGLLVIFSCNTCPFVVGREGKSQGWENRYNDLYKMADYYKMGSVLVNSNEAKREGDDSKEAMVAHAKEQNYLMPYVIDKNHQLADAFGARTTPHVYLFNGDMELVYVGAIDDNVDNAKDVKEHYLLDAMKATFEGTSVRTSTTKALGCSIKRIQS